MSITIGMAHYEDAHRASMTLQALRLYQQLTEDDQLLLIDTYPEGPGGLAIRKFCDSTGKVDYIGVQPNPGSARAKNLVFEKAKGDIVVCMDCHVLPQPGVIDRIKRYFHKNPKSRDLLTAPLLYNDLWTLSTHMDPVWRGENWGTWASNDLARNDNAPPFEIWGTGCFMMACRKEAWPKFNEHFWGFGSEEGYIHEKVRQQGGKVLCCPWMKTWHSFMPGSAKYALVRWHKLRNYVIGFQELGLPLDSIYAHYVSLDTGNDDLPTHLVKEHSVDPKELNGMTDEAMQALHKKFKVSQEDWDYMLQDPIKHISAPKEKPTLESLYSQIQQVKGDMDHHMDLLRSYASRVETVQEVTRRKASTVALLAGHPKRLRSHVYGPDSSDPMYANVKDLLEAAEFVVSATPTYVEPEIEECDLLFLKPDHIYKNLGDDLERWHSKVKRFIIIHATQSHGVKLEDGSPGYGMSMRVFTEDHPEWFVVHHTAEQYGVTVLGKLEEDRPAHQIHAWPPGKGPGTELKHIMASIGVNPTPTCGCNSKAMQMDMWGVDECEKQFDTIVEWLRKGAPNWGWAERMRIAANAGLTGLAFKVNWVDPFPGIVRLAIDRARARENTVIKAHALLPPKDQMEQFTPDWRLSKPAIEAIADLLSRHKPISIFESGPGASSWIFFKYAELTGATYEVLNHLGEWDDHYRKWCTDNGFPLTSVRSVPLAQNKFYDLEKAGSFSTADFICLDGPGDSDARNSQEAKMLLAKIANPLGAIIVVDDANRPAEAALVKWLTEKGFRVMNVVQDDVFAHRLTAILQGSFK